MEGVAGERAPRSAGVEGVKTNFWAGKSLVEEDPSWDSGALSGVTTSIGCSLTSEGGGAAGEVAASEGGEAGAAERRSSVEGAGGADVGEESSKGGEEVEGEGAEVGAVTGEDGVIGE